MKIKKYLLALLLSSSAFLMTGSLNADMVMSAEAAVASGDELAGDYLALLEAQGEYAYAFDFFTTSMLWTVIAAALVFLMHLGFATLEAGLTQSKNTVNILFKNVFIISIGILSYAVIGFNTHYPGDFNGWVAFGSFIGAVSYTHLTLPTNSLV